MCNSCGRPAGKHEEYDHANYQYYFQIQGFYGTDYPEDLTAIRFKLCQHCLKRLTNNFYIPPDEFESYDFEGNRCNELGIYCE